VSDTVLVALIGAAGTVVAALIGLVGILVAKRDRRSSHRLIHDRDDDEVSKTGRHTFFYAMILAGVANLLAFFLVGPFAREIFRDDAIPALKSQFILLAILAFVIAFFNRNRRS
jgi:hypothetical protein